MSELRSAADRSVVGVPLRQGAMRAAARPVRLAALRAPLAVKVIGAHLFVLAALGAFLMSAPAGGWSAAAAIAVTGSLSLVYVGLVAVALRPIRDLEAAAARVWRGDLGARVDPSAVADADVLRIGSMFNILLDGLASDRARMRLLASEVIKAGDRERALLARELHDSTAQRMAALLLQIGAAARDCTDEALRERLTVLRESMQDVLEEVRVLSHTVHPRVLDDLGLEAALENLGRESGRAAGVDIVVAVRGPARSLPPMVASVLYRVAQEGIQNVMRHARASRASIDVEIDDDRAWITIKDDGIGFDVPTAEQERRGMGVFSMRERVELVDGNFSIESAPMQGTTISAMLPLPGDEPGRREGERNS